MQHVSKFRIRTITMLVASTFAAPMVAQAEKAEALETGKIEIIGTTPLPSVGVTIDQVPSAVQAATADQINEQHPLDLSEYIGANLGSVSITEGQSNVYMPDVNFRGFTATPLAGAPVGMSVFMDGVRINEPFGDTVNWSAIPHTAIANINLIPGSNPVFGLNTLGGALSIHTKSGSKFPGGAIEAVAGSWQRKGINAEYGGSKDNLEWFLTGNFVSEDGWREHSTSQVNQMFGKFGWENESTDLDLSILAVNNNLEGVQAVPRSWGSDKDDRKEGYTWPDRNDSNVYMVNLEGSHFFTEEKLVSGNIYARKSRIQNFASNVNDDFDPLFPDEEQGFNEKSETDQEGVGFSLQYSDLGKLWGHGNQFTVGFSFDGGRSKYKSFEQEVDEFDDDRAAPSDEEFEKETDVTGKNQYYGLYFTDTFSVTDKFTLTASGRYNYIKVKVRDNMEPELITDPASPFFGQELFVTGTEENEVEHRFNRFNPAIGLNYNPNQSLTFFGGYNEGMRAPTPIELACANPDIPCRMPTDFLADPPLDPVVAKSWEAGARGRLSESFQWNATGFYSTLHDDIQFISAGTAANLGYFQNVGKTRRKGVELGLQGRFDKLSLAANYTYLRATFETPVTFHSPFNSSANVDGDIVASRGDTLPGLPEHALKLRLGYEVTPKFNVGLNMLSFSGVYARGDENNQDENGKVPGYTVFNLDARYKFGNGWSAFARVNNIFDKEYSTMGVLGVNAFNTPDRTFNVAGEAGWSDEQFRSPGAPRAGWIGVRYEFGGARVGSSGVDLD